MASIVTDIVAELLGRARKLIKGKDPITSDRCRNEIAAIELQIANRESERSALESRWADSLLEATVADQAKHKAELDAFDLQSAQLRAAVAALHRRLGEAIAGEAEAAFQGDVARARQLLDGVDEEAAAIDALAEQLCARYASFHARQRAFAQIMRTYRDLYSDGLRGDKNAETLNRRWSDEMAGASAITCRLFFSDQILRTGKDYVLHRLSTGAVLWPSAEVEPPLGWGSR